MRSETALALSAAAVLLTAVLLAAGCEQFQQTLDVAADLVEQHPGLIPGEEDRAKWTAGARLAKSLVNEISVREEIGIGQSLALRAFASFGQPYPDEDLQRYVARVGKLVALQSERPSLPYSFAVVQSEKPNALALPGGFVFVSTGLLRRLRSESELACILGHEICHVAQKHGIEIVERDRVISRMVDFGAVLKEDVGEYRQFIDLTYQKLTTEGYDRRYEWIADEAGVRYAFAAGYHPGGLLPFMEESRRSATPMAFEVFKTHPDPGVRIEKIHAVLGALGPYSATPKLAARYQREALAKLL
ncbi:MAG: M48 family metalloprotease [Candidatus Brocadiae bacterium]|nr:M48 family metalloprotease [Candidatus Brocadiia bacterium]